MNNEITPAKPRAPRPLSAPQQPTQSLGIFEDFDAFRGAFEIAKALSKTQLIPKQFQGKPEDCLIALDYARRLGVAPTAIMPHLFCVYGTPSMSAQMMIALVNRSGRFSRIEWQEGTDGKVSYVGLGDKKTEVPNYYAQASFTEVATGKTYTSERVDMRLAVLSGWITKGHDKGMLSMWEKIPQTMLRYRSASTLIKKTCPELMLGLDTVEDARDYASAPAYTPTVEVQTTTADEISGSDDPAPDPIDEIIAAINAAADSDALEVIGNDIGQAGFSEDQLARLRPAFLARRAELEQLADGQGNVE